MTELIHAFTETHYKNYPAYINISKHAGEQIVLIVREQENNGTKCASIKLSIKELEYLAKDINNHLKIEDRNYTAIEEKLESAKQRELELLAVIEKIKAAFKFAAEMAAEGDDSDIREAHIKMLEALNAEPSQALREHEAKVLEELLGTFAFFQTEEGLWLATAIRRMAEERRKK